ncbi:MAG TPA: hypothetical protein PL182_06775 [Pseudobdellovibrionaceae bacterium]|nr:hypothetical protein [Pseudobdellovibrionaceae bacterium]
MEARFSKYDRENQKTDEIDRSMQKPRRQDALPFTRTDIHVSKHQSERNNRHKDKDLERGKPISRDETKHRRVHEPKTGTAFAPTPLSGKKFA